MVLPAQERILVIADAQRQVESALMAAVPTAEVTAVGSYFDAIAELAEANYTAVLASAEPIERRPEAAVKTLRDICGDARLILFGHPTLEPLSRKMLEFGCDDYVVTPASAGELLHIFGAPVLRVTKPAVDEPPAPPSALQTSDAFGGVLLADVMLDALLEHPAAAATAATAALGQRLGPNVGLSLDLGKGELPPLSEGLARLSHAIWLEGRQVGQLHLVLPKDDDPETARHLLARLAAVIGKLQALQDRHKKLQKLAITDEMTGLFNGRYFRHFLANILERAKVMRFSVTLLLFDIDNFKKYNDLYGHGVGDEILKQTAALMKRCTREHDLVARIGGDEFAVVFWDKDGPRQPRDPKTSANGPPGRPPQDVQRILERFRRLMATQQFPGLGPTGMGVLTISGGLSVFPWNGQSMEELIEAADKTLMFGAKRADGKNSIFLVGGNQASGDVR